MRKNRHRPVEGPTSDTRVVGKGLAFCIERVRALAARDLPMLITGQTGTGKEILAREYARAWCHTRRGARFAVVNCTGFSEELLRSELFGYVRGAFTGAERDHEGLAKKYDLICLDELGDTGVRFQAQLLRVVETGEYLRVGSPQVEQCETRFVASTNRLEGVRRDLAYRFHPVAIPPLTVRGEDIIDLVMHFGDGKVGEFTERFAIWAAKYTWPGNVRELRRAVEEGGLCGLLDIAPLVPSFDNSAAFNQSVRGGERLWSRDTRIPLREFPARFQIEHSEENQFQALAHLEWAEMDRRRAAQRNLQTIARGIERLSQRLAPLVGHATVRAGFPQEMAPGKSHGLALTQHGRELRNELLQCGSVAELARRRGMKESAAHRLLRAENVDHHEVLRHRRSRRQTRDR